MPPDQTIPLSGRRPVQDLPAALDPAVARAVNLIQKCFAEDLDLDRLAREAHLSRTVLHERFVENLGEPPIRYCARWRMHVAANMLRAGDENTARIAYAVGFNSEAAFNRAFKREFGHPPAAWKKLLERNFAFDPEPRRLRISSTPTGANWLTRHISAFLDANPDLAVELEPNPRFVNFETESLDCGIRAGRTVPTDVHVEHLFRTDFTPMCSPAFLAAHPELRTPADLRHLSRMTPNDPWWRAWWNAFDVEPPSFTGGPKWEHRCSTASPR